MNPRSDRTENQERKGDDKDYILFRRTGKITAEQRLRRPGVAATGTIEPGQAVQTALGEKMIFRPKICSTQGEGENDTDEPHGNRDGPLSRCRHQGFNPSIPSAIAPITVRAMNPRLMMSPTPKEIQHHILAFLEASRAAATSPR